MKKIFTLTLLSLIVSLGVNAQSKKTWDFTKGLSAETVDNLNADEANWKANGTDSDGHTNNWQNAVKPSPNEELTANGVVIKETAGLLFDIGNNKSNSIHIAQNKIRLTRANTTITFPKLKNGQKVTIVGRSTNVTATDRGIEPVQDHIQFVSGERTNDKCIFLGNSVEGSLVTYSFTWEIVTTEQDAVDVQFKLSPNAGIDFTLFMIDDGGEKCEKPTITLLSNGKIKVESATEGATCVTNITASNAKPITDKEINMDTAFVVYTVTAQASKEGFYDSDIATSTFRWEKKEGDMNSDGTVNIGDVVKLVNMILGE